MKIILVITVIICIITSCGIKSALKNVEADEVLVDVSYVDESFFEKYDTYDSFIENEDHPRIAFTSNVPVKDFCWLSLSLNFDDNDELFYEVDKVLYSLKELRPQNPFVATWIEVGMMSVFGFSYRDKNGQKKYFVGRTGNYGQDPEEYDGPGFVVWQFFPTKMVTGRYACMYDETTLILDLAETSYTLKVNDVVYTGTAVIDLEKLNDGTDYWFVNLDGIKWAWWDKKNFSRPSRVFLWLLDVDQLVFQNRGDPMAPYAIFDGITDKYVSMKRDK